MLKQPVTGTRRATSPPAIDGISNQRVLPPGKVHADLVGSARLQADIEVGMSAKTLSNAVVSHSGPAIWYHRHLGPGGGVSTNRAINRATPCKSTPAHCRVAATKAPIRELGNQ